MSRAKRSSIFLGAVAALLLLASTWFWFNRQYVQDLLIVRQFVPSSEIASISERVKFTDHGRFLFYASEPEINDAESFNIHCSRREPVAAVLGCYRDQNIYIYKVDNSELDGIREVTAVHEMLHAAWDRLSVSERNRLTPLLEESYQKHKTDELEERMKYYDRQQPGERVNELHSILATETADLGQELEDYYQQYFVDRQKIVLLHDSYQSVFTELEQQAEKLQSELEKMSSRLNQDIADHNDAIEDLNSRIEAHNQAFSSVDRANPYEVEAYNLRRAEIQAEQERLRSTRQDLDDRREEYNKKLEQYNEIVVHTSALTNSIDSLKAPTDFGL